MGRYIVRRLLPGAVQRDHLVQPGQPRPRHAQRLRYPSQPLRRQIRPVHPQVIAHAGPDALRVRLRETPGPLSWGTVLLRWLGQNWYGIASGVPILGSVVSLWPVIDLLWPLWDDRRQALHDKFAGTSVVRTR